MSDFNHFELESSPAGRLVSWYNVQFYCGWGDAGDERLYEAIVQSGWNPRKVVLGVVTNAENGSGFVHAERLGRCVTKLKEKYGNEFGGVMGWEYFNAGGDGRPEEWVRNLARLLGRSISASSTTSTGERGAKPSAGAPVPTPSDTADIQAAMQDATLLGGSTGSASQGDAASTGPAQQAAPSSEDSAKVQRLVDMGFDRSEAVAALEAMGGDVDAAAGILFGD